MTAPHTTEVFHLNVVSARPGDCTVVIVRQGATPPIVVMIDGGEDIAALNECWEPFAVQQGLKDADVGTSPGVVHHAINAIVCTHYDTDHAKALDEFLLQDSLRAGNLKYITTCRYYDIGVYKGTNFDTWRKLVRPANQAFWADPGGAQQQQEIGDPDHFGRFSFHYLGRELLFDPLGHRQTITDMALPAQYGDLPTLLATRSILPTQPALLCVAINGRSLRTDPAAVPQPLDPHDPLLTDFEQYLHSASGGKLDWQPSTLPPPAPLEMHERETKHSPAGCMVSQRLTE